MLHLMKTEGKKIWLPVLLTAGLLSGVACILSCTLYAQYSLLYDLEAWEVGTEFFGLAYPLFVVIPLCWNLYYERKNSFLLYVLPRVSIRKYLTAKWIMYALGAFCIIAAPYFLSAIAALYLKPPIVPYVAPGEATAFNHVFLAFYIQQPFLYALLLSLWKGFIGVLVMTMGFVLALFSDNIFVVLTGPFLYGILENFILSVLELSQWRLVTAYEPTCISADAMSPSSFVVGPLLLLAVTAFLAFYFSKVKKRRIVEI